MFKKKAFIPLLSIIALASCTGNTNSNVIINSDQNYDSDQISEIVSSGEENSYDSEPIEEDPVEVPSEYDTFSDGTITAEGKYYLKGNYDGISITASKGSVIYVFMDGATINSNAGIAFGSSKAITLYLVLLNNSVNSVTNDFTDTNAFHIKGEVHISGEGTLNIESKQKTGLKVSKDLFISGDVTINVTAANHGVAAQSLTASGATINILSAVKDGIQLECDSDVQEFTKEQGFAYLIDTNVTANVYGDGIQADTFVYISGGTYNIKTETEFVSYSTANKETYGLVDDDFKFIKNSSGEYQRVSKDEISTLSSKYYALANSAKGIKAGAIEYDSDGDDVDDVTVTTGDYDIFIAHTANITINSYDDCIHTNYGDAHLDSSNFVLETYDDGAHADYNLDVNNASIQINKSYEGLEASTVTINGELTNIVSISQDDGINAASDLTSQHYIYINDGYLRVYASGDGLDANTALYLNGGTVIVEGPGSGNGSLEADQIYFKGGIVFSCSTSGMTERMTATQNTFLWQGSTISANTKVSIVDSNNNAIFSYTLKQSCNQIIFSHSELTIGSSYQLVGGTTSIATIKMTSSLTKVGNSQGGGPGGHGGPGGW